MNKSLMILLLIGVYLFSGLAYPVNAVEFTNGGFENWSSSTDCDNWIETLSMPEDNISICDTYSHNGTYSMNITNSGGSSPPYALQNNVNSTNGNTYTFSIWYYDNDPDVYVELYLAFGANYAYAYNDPENNDTDGWRQLYVTVTCGSTENQGELRISVVAPAMGMGSIYFDDVQFYEGAFQEFTMQNTYITIISLSIVSILIITAIIFKKKKK